MQGVKKLLVAEFAHQLAVATYRHTESYPAWERFGITSQMRRAAVSIASNIAERCGRRGNSELLTFLYYASGSARELICQLRIPTELGFGEQVSAEQLRVQSLRVAKMLTRLINVLISQATPRQQEGRP